MSNTTQHTTHTVTPGPWAVGETFDNDGMTETVIRGWGGEAAVAVTLDFGPNNPGMREANAAFIVRACNAHAALVNALQLLADKVEACGGYPGFRDELEHARAALHMAEA